MIKKFLFIFIFCLVSYMSFAQADRILKHDGEIIEGSIIRTTTFSIVFNHKNETSENEISKYAIAKIIYGGSGRIEEITEKIIINDKKDWEKVVILEDNSAVTGLSRIDEIRGKTAFLNLHTGNTGDRKALKKLKTAAAKINCPFILITSEKSTVGSRSNELGGSQNIKTAIAYKY